MDLGKILADPGAAATLIGVILAAILTLGISVVVQIWGERRKQMQIAFSRNMETPSILAKSGIDKKLQISYQGKNVSNLRYFSVNIVNTGKKPINDFLFECEFDTNIQAVDPHFPEIHTETPPAIQPDMPVYDQVNSTANKYQYAVKSLAVSQKITISFLFANSKTDRFEVRFIHPNYEIREANVSTFSTLEKNIVTALVNTLLFFIISQAAPLISVGMVFLIGFALSIIVAFVQPHFYSFDLLNVFNQLSPLLSSLGDLIGVVLGLPFLLRAYRAVRPIIPTIAKKLQEKLNI